MRKIEIILIVPDHLDLKLCEFLVYSLYLSGNTLPSSTPQFISGFCPAVLHSEEHTALPLNPGLALLSPLLGRMLEVLQKSSRESSMAWTTTLGPSTWTLILEIACANLRLNA